MKTFSKILKMHPSVGLKTFLGGYFPDALAQSGVQGATVGEKVDIEVNSVASESNAEATDDVAQATAEVAEEAQTGSV